MHQQSEEQAESQVRVEKYRWLILIVYCCFSAVNFGQYLQYSIISNIIQKYYQVSSLGVDLSSLIFQIIYILGFIPCSFIIEKHNLKIIAVVSTGLTAVGNLLKLLSVERDRYYLVVISQGFCAIAQVFLMSIPSKVASTWFGADEVSTACAIAVLGTQLGVAIGCIMSPLMVSSQDNVDDIGDGLFQLIIINAAITVAIFIITLLTFKARPKLPPSQSQLNLLSGEEEKGISFWKPFGALFRNKNFILLLVIFGISNGLWNCFGILFNELYLKYFPNAEQDAGIIVLSSLIAGGCIGSVVFGFILDKTHKFKLVTFIALLCATVTFAAAVTVLETKIKLATFIVIPVFGFFTASTLVIGFEFVLEITYPVPESASCSSLNAVIYIFTLLFTYAFEGLFDLVGFLKTDIGINIIFLICTCLTYFISSNLNRRDANEAIN